MEEVVLFITLFGSGFLVVKAIVGGIVRSKEVKSQAQFLGQLAERAGSGESLVTVLESEAGRSLFRGMVDRRTLILNRVLTAVQSGIVLSFLGVGLFVIRTQATGQDERFGLAVLTILAITLGIAFLTSAAASYGLSRKWGLLSEGSQLP